MNHKVQFAIPPELKKFRQLKAQVVKLGITIKDLLSADVDKRIARSKQ